MRILLQMSMRRGCWGHIDNTRCVSVATSRVVFDRDSHLDYSMKNYYVDGFKKETAFEQTQKEKTHRVAYHAKPQQSLPFPSDRRVSKPRRTPYIHAPVRLKTRKRRHPTPPLDQHHKELNLTSSNQTLYRRGESIGIVYMLQ